jgi:hypothetical protein
MTIEKDVIKRLCNELLEQLKIHGVYCFVITRGKQGIITEIVFKRIK